MKISNSLHQKGNKLNYYVQIPTNFSDYQCKKPNLSLHREKSRLITSSTQSPHTKQHFNSSFYDNFDFVDRLTNNKMAYKEARKSSNSLLQFRKTSTRLQEKHPGHSLLHIYKKTKDFQMKSLKKKIFKKLEQKQPIMCTQKKIKENEQNKLYKDIKHGSFTSLKQNSTQFVERSQKKNKLKSFVDKTVNDMNKAQLKRIITENDFSIKNEVLQFNGQLNKIKCTLDKQKIDNLIYLREKQQFELGNTEYFNKKQDPIVFKDLTNFGVMINDDVQIQQKQTQNSIPKNYGRIKKKKLNSSQERDNFLQKMLIHAKSYLRKQGEYLINPSKQKQARNMLLKKGKKQFILSGYKNSSIKTQNTFDLSSFSFQKKQQSSLISQIKNLVSKQKRNQTFTCGKQSINKNKQKGKQCKKEKDIVYLLKNNFISNVGIQLMSNSETCFTKDQKGNNLLHLAIRFQRHEAIDMMFKKLPYKTCRFLLTQKNNHKRTPLQLAEMLVDHCAVQIINKWIDDNRQKQIMQGWMKQSIHNEI